jgi:hypothetical protein
MKALDTLDAAVRGYREFLLLPYQTLRTNSFSYNFPSRCKETFRRDHILLNRSAWMSLDHVQNTGSILSHWLLYRQDYKVATSMNNLVELLSNQGRYEPSINQVQSVSAHRCEPTLGTCQ